MRQHYMIVNRVTLCNFHDYNKLTGTLVYGKRLIYSGKSKYNLEQKNVDATVITL